uniref:G protein-coupled receptor n=1 Tax=Pristionchus pacificus TaxID=54126 RepID=A0A8R1UA41_PRIPA
MSASKYAAICAILVGLANLIVYTGYEASVFINESVLHSVSEREPGRIGAHDGYYGQAVSNVFYMLSTLAVPSLMNYFRCKWILALSGAFFTFYFLTFQCLNRYLYFIACAVLGMASSSFNVGYAGYLTEFSTRQTIERNQALSWAVSCLSVFGAGVVNYIVTSINLNDHGIVSKYREYSEPEIRYFFAVFAFLGVVGMTIFSLLPNREVKDNIAASNIRCNSLKEQLSVMFSVLVHKRVLILVPFYLYVGMFFSFWVSIIPTTLQFTGALSRNVYIPAYFAFAFTAGSLIMSVLTMKMSKRMKNFSFKPQMIINAVLHILIYVLTVCVIPQWSTVRPNDELSLLIQPSLFPVLILAFLFGLADAANYITRNVISSLLLPTRRQQMFGASRFYHGLAASVLFFASPSLSIYSYAIIQSVFLVASTIVYLYTCEFIQNEEERADKVAQISSESITNLLMFVFRIWFWVPVLIILIPSTVVHFLLFLAIRKRQRENQCKSLSYRLFVVQSILELLLLYLYLSGRILIKDRLLSNEAIMSLNGEIFPRFYYHGTVYYFFNVQIWGVIVQALMNCIRISNFLSFSQRWFDSTPSFVFLLINMIVPFALLFQLLLPDGIRFIVDGEGNAVLSVPREIVQRNAMQSTIFTAVATALCAACSMFYAIALRRLWKIKWKLSASELKREKMLAVSGIALFLSQCTMTAYYVVVTFTAVDNEPVVAYARNIYMFPVLLLTFVNPWMLIFTNGKLRRTMCIFNAWLWIPVFIVLVPSTILHILLILAVLKEQNNGQCTSSVIELPLLYVHIACQILIRARLAGSDFIMSTNGGFFPLLYYHGTIFYFFSCANSCPTLSQTVSYMWNAIVYSLARFVIVCSPFFTTEIIFENIPHYAWFLINILVTFVLVLKQLIHDNVSFVTDQEGNANIFIPQDIILYFRQITAIRISKMRLQTNSSQATCFTVIGTIFSASCYALVMRKFKCPFHVCTQYGFRNTSDRRSEKMVTLVGFALFLSQCTMTVCYREIIFHSARS